MWQRQPQRLADDLRRRGGTEELATTARRAASAAAKIRGLRQAQLASGKSHSNRLHFAGVFSIGSRQSDTSGNQHGRQFMHRRQRHHHRRKAFVAGGHPDDAAAGGQRADQPPKNLRRVVAVRQAIHHAAGALRTAVTGIGAETGEGYAAQRLHSPRGFFHQQTDLVVPGVIAQRDGAAIGSADAALGAENQNFLAAEGFRIPAHAGVLSPAENVSAGSRSQHLFGQGQRPLGAGRTGADFVDRWVRGCKQIAGHS